MPRSNGFDLFAARAACLIRGAGHSLKASISTTLRLEGFVYHSRLSHVPNRPGIAGARYPPRAPVPSIRPPTSPSPRRLRGFLGWFPFLVQTQPGALLPAFSSADHMAGRFPSSAAVARDPARRFPGVPMAGKSQDALNFHSAEAAETCLNVGGVCCLRLQEVSDV